MANATNMIPKRSALQTVRKGVTDRPLRVLLYGVEKIGKTTFASGAPSPIFIGADSGGERLDIHRNEPRDWDEAISFINEYATAPHDYKTIVIDPLNWFEPMCWEAFMKREGWYSIEEPEKGKSGYGKGYNGAVDLWREFLAALDRCWLRGMHVVILAHAQVKPFDPPDGAAKWDRYELAMNVKAAAPFKQWVDCVLFAQLETHAKIEKGARKAKGLSAGVHIVHTKPNAAYDAGSRWRGMPEEIPLGWDELLSAIKAAEGTTATLGTRITDMIAQLNDPKVAEFATAFAEKHKNNADRLTELVNRLQVKLEEKVNKEKEIAS